jgi:peptidyl-prolyl cis-trans isomerase A (cyclophilin A)
MRARIITVFAIVCMIATIATAQTEQKPYANPANLKEPAPKTFKANFETSAGNFVIEVHRDWSPNGADRFYNLVKSGFYDNVRFYRVISGFMAQFGIHGDPAVTAKWRTASIPDDGKAKESNLRGYVTFAKTGAPNSRTTQVFINYGNNAQSLDALGFTPFGRVTSGMNVVDKLYSSYGDIAEQPNGRGPSQQKFGAEGNAYLEKSFPKLDYIKKATIAP